jgi:hypothetical protein
VAAQNGTHSPPTVQSALAPVTVAAYCTQDISLAALMNQFPAALPFCSVRIQYSGPPGSVEAQVSSVESKGDLVVDSRVQNEGNGWAGSGAHPWHLDDDTESILFLTNESNQVARIAAKVAANGVTYYLTRLKLNPHETRAIDIRKLRDAQQPDFMKNTIPPDAADGSFIWVRADNVPVMGRMMLIHRQQGMASNYDCSICVCPASYQPWLDYVSPASADILVQGTVTLGYYGGFWDCNYGSFYLLMNAPSWSSGNTSIATVNSSGTVTGQSGGSVTISGQCTAESWFYNPSSGCMASFLYGTASANIYVQVPTGLTVASTISSQANSACGSGYTGWDRWLWWEVLDQWGGPIQVVNMYFYDTITAQGASACNLQGNGNGCWLTNFRLGSGYTNSQGQFKDHYFFCSSCCACTTSASQTYYVNNAPIAKTIRYTCSGITINGQ